MEGLEGEGEGKPSEEGQGLVPHVLYVLQAQQQTPLPGQGGELPEDPQDPLHRPGAVACTARVKPALKAASPSSRMASRGSRGVPKVPSG